MTFKLTEEQSALKETISRSFSEASTSEYVRRVVNKEHGGQSLWPLMKELGLFEYFSDAQGSSFVELAIIAHESGKTLLPIDIAGALFFGPFLLGSNEIYKHALNTVTD